MNSVRLLLEGLIVALAVSSGSTTPQTLAETLELAKRRERPVLLVLTNAWSDNSDRWTRDTLRNPILTTWADQHALLVELDVEDDFDQLRALDILDAPTSFLLRPDGTEIVQVFGARDARTLIDELDAALAGRTPTDVKPSARTATEREPMQRQERADAHVAAGELAEALNDYLWCFDHGAEVDPSYQGVRLSFLLGDIAKLGKTHPPAIEALEVRAARAESAVLADPTNSSAWDELTSIAGAQHQRERVTTLIDRLDPTHVLAAPLRDRILDQMLGSMISHRSYSEVRWLCAGSASAMATHWERKFEIDRSVIERHWKNKGFYGLTPEDWDTKFLEQRAELAGKIAQLYEAELAVGTSAAADALVERTLSLEPRLCAYQALATGAERVRKIDAAIAIARRGERALRDDDAQKLSTLAREFEARRK